MKPRFQATMRMLFGLVLLATTTESLAASSSAPVRVFQSRRRAGGTPGYRTFLGFVPSRQMGVVVLTNSGRRGADDIGYHLLDPSSPLESRQ
jgi:hypothetical protein